MNLPQATFAEIRFRRFRAAILFFCVAAVGFLSNVPLAAQQITKGKTAAATTTPRERWRMILLGGSHVGYMHEHVRAADREGKRIVLNESVVVLSVALPRTQVGAVSPAETRSKIMIHTEETPNGDLLSFRYEVRDPPQVSMLQTAAIANGRLRIETQSAAGTSAREESWDASVKGPAFADRILLSERWKPGEVRAVTTFDPRTVKADAIRMEARDWESVVLQDGTERRLLHIVSTHSVATDAVIHEYLDDAGEVWKTTLPSQNMVVLTVPKEQALRGFAPADDVSIR